MKTQKLSSWILVAIMAISGLSLSAQNGQGRNFNNTTQTQNRLIYLDLTEAQQVQAKTFFTEMQRQSTPLRADLQEKQAQLSKLMIADPSNEKDIYAKVDEMADIRLDLQKIRLSHRLQMRTILDADQKVLFDAREIGNRNRSGSSKGNRGGNRGNNGGGQGMGSGNRF
ncbi:MAG: periplasmic heavy metal sensor [Bacteroidales bacterium]|nr:periplasmic heavy metal sensor [Bacteroidales bacterium]